MGPNLDPNCLLLFQLFSRKVNLGEKSVDEKACNVFQHVKDLKAPLLQSLAFCEGILANFTIGNAHK